MRKYGKGMTTMEMVYSGPCLQFKKKMEEGRDCGQLRKGIFLNVGVLGV